MISLYRSEKSLISYLGIIFSFILTSIIAYSHLKTWSILIYLLIVYVLGHITEGIFITPKFKRRATFAI